MKLFEIIRVSGIATGVGFTEKRPDGEYSELICSTLFDSGNDEKDARDSEIWAQAISRALDKFYNQK